MTRLPAAIATRWRLSRCAAGRRPVLSASRLAAAAVCVTWWTCHRPRRCRPLWPTATCLTGVSPPHHRRRQGGGPHSGHRPCKIVRQQPRQRGRWRRTRRWHARFKSSHRRRLDVTVAATLAGRWGRLLEGVVVVSAPTLWPRGRCRGGGRATRPRGGVSPALVKGVGVPRRQQGPRASLCVPRVPRTRRGEVWRGRRVCSPPWISLLPLPLSAAWLAPAAMVATAALVAVVVVVAAAAAAAAATAADAAAAVAAKAGEGGRGGGRGRSGGVGAKRRPKR